MAKVRGVYKRGDYYWIRYAGPDGRIIRESSQSKLFRDAEGLLLQRKREVLEGKLPIPKRMAAHTFNELAGHYLAWAEKQKSFRSKKSIVLLLAEEMGNIPLRHFTTRLVEEYQSRLIQGRSPATVNRRITVLKHMLNKAADWEMVEEEVLKKVRKVKLLRENNQRLRYLSREEIQALIEACTPHLRPVVVTALNTGMRKEEILSLEWGKHVDLRHGFILLQKTKNGEKREVPINGTLRGTLAQIPRRLDSPYVFTGENGKRFKDLKRSFGTALKRAGIRDFRFHDLRHTFASHLAMAGVDPVSMKELLGHKDLKMTMRYTHLAPGHKVKAVNILDEALNGQSTDTKTAQWGKMG